MIEVQNVSKAFGTFRAVDDISFSIKTGEIVGLLGPNGAGKTTTMRMITGYIDATAGTIKVDGQDILKDPRLSKRKIGYMPESAPLYSDMIVADYLEYIAKMQGVNPEEKVPQLCNVCGLSEVMHKNISELSRGYRQRVGLAHALMNDPEILILDEPTSGLDPNQIGDVRALIKEIGKTRTVIISTHILSEVEMLCDRVIIISKGKLAADCPTNELRTRYGSSNMLHVSVAGCNYEEFASVCKSLSGVAGVVEMQAEKIDGFNPENCCAADISVSGDTELRPMLFNLASQKGWVLYEIVLERNSIEDVFRTLTIGGEQ